MAQTTFQGPVRSLNGFINSGPGSVVNLANGTNTVTVDAATYAGRITRTNDATLVITLPAINASADEASAGPGSDPNNPSTIGNSYTFFVETTATTWQLKTDGTDKFVGSITMVATDAAGACTAYAPGAANDCINFNGTTTGGIAGSWVTVTALASAKYYVQGVTLGSGTVATPFADS